MLKDFQMIQELCVCTRAQVWDTETERDRNTEKVHENAPIGVLDRMEWRKKYEHGGYESDLDLPW